MGNAALWPGVPYMTLHVAFGGFIGTSNGVCFVKVAGLFHSPHGLVAFCFSTAGRN